MEVMVGSSFGIGMSAYVRNQSGVTAQDKAVTAALFLADGSKYGGSQIRNGLKLSNKSSEESSADSSSSIGESSENEEEEEEEENDAVSFQGALESFSSSLEESLSIKRGLSNHYGGKSKSFGNLMEASNSNAKDLEKAENPFNKRRRLIIANKLRRRGRSFSASHFYTWPNPNSVPLLALQEPSEEDNNDDDYEDEDGDDQTTKLLEKRKIMMIKKNKRDLLNQTQSCFCLSSLQEECDNGDDDDDDDE